MAEPAEPVDPSRRYASIENAYCEDRWNDVLEEARDMLRDLGEDEDPTAMGLRQRLQLLMAHSHLYGLGDRDSAEDLYAAVLASKAEPALRQSAEQGLRQCDQPTLWRRIPEEPPDPTSEAASSQAVSLPAFLTPATIAAEAAEPQDRRTSQPPAMPWLTGSGAAAAEVIPSTSASIEPPPASFLIPEVVEEPELIELHQADPSLAEEIELEISPLSGGGEVPEDDQDDPELVRCLLHVSLG